jgi:hypothetical protein
MAYKIFWQVPQQVLCMELEGNLNLDHFNQINQMVVDLLDDKDTDQPVTLLVDITRPGKIPQAFAQLKESQTYASRHDLKFIVVAGNDKFMRLMMLLTFNLCRPSLRFFDNIDQGLKFAQRISSANVVNEVLVQ